MLPGLDVSYLDEAITWPLVVRAGMRFVFIRASHGGTADTYFQDHWSGAGAVGLARGAYHYFEPSTDPRTQAAAFLATLGGDFGELPLVVDLEELGTITPLTPAQLVASVRVFLASLPRRTTIIYGSPAFLNALPLAELPARTKLWVANYNVSRPTVAQGWPTWTFWQYGSGWVPGCPMQVADLDWFNGTERELRSLIAPSWGPIVLIAAGGLLAGALVYWVLED